MTKKTTKKSPAKKFKMNKEEMLGLNLIHTQRQLTAAQAEKAESAHNRDQEKLLTAIGHRLGINPDAFVFHLDTGEVKRKPVG